MRFKSDRIGIVYRCDSCNEPVFLRFRIARDPGNSRAIIADEYEEVELPGEDFEFKYLKGEVYQLADLKAMAQIDEETFSLLKQIVIDGHDGAHPHLPKLNRERAAVLLELMKDVLYQLYVRKGKLQEAMSLRADAGKIRRS